MPRAKKSATAVAARLSAPLSTDDVRVPPIDALAVERVQPSYVQVAAQLRALILSGRLALGQRLPVESEFCSMFGVSRSTIREALRLLAAENLIEARRGTTGGTFVVHPDARDIEATLGTALSLLLATDQLTTPEVEETWLAFEPTAARLAARRRSDEDVERLMALSDPPPPGLSDGELTLFAMEFHRVLLDACGNRLLVMVTRPLLRLGPERQIPQPIRPFLTQAVEEHRVIAQAVADQDEDLAYSLMTEHFDRPTNAQPLARRRSHGH